MRGKLARSAINFTRRSALEFCRDPRHTLDRVGKQIPSADSVIKTRMLPSSDANTVRHVRPRARQTTIGALALLFPTQKKILANARERERGNYSKTLISIKLRSLQRGSGGIAWLAAATVADFMAFSESYSSRAASLQSLRQMESDLLSLSLSLFLELCEQFPFFSSFFRGKKRRVLFTVSEKSFYLC